MQTVSLKNITASLLIAALIIGLGVFSVLTSQAQGRPYRAIVTFNHGLNEQAREALENMGGKVLKELPLVNGAVVLLPSEAAAKNVGALADIKRVEEDAVVYALHHRNGHTGGPGSDDGGSTPPPPQTLEWGVDRIDAELAWPTSTGVAVKVAVIDTGIDKDHADLVDNLKGGVNFVVTNGPWWKSADPSKWDDDNGHGTHVAGIVAAVNNSQGVVGVAPNAHLYAVKALDRNGSGYVSDIVDGIYWAINNGMHVINMSLGTSSDIQSLHDAVDAAYNAGLVVVAAAGNSGDGDPSTNEVSYPAKYSSVIAVAATASDDSTPYWSSEGAEVELAAPGVNVHSTWNDGSYKTISGTSMASPHVAGVAALVLTTTVQAGYDSDADGLWDPSEVRVWLQATADDLGATGHDNHYGHGLVDAEEAATGVQTNN